MLKVIVVGAGIAGLSAAISLRRAGHCVSIYEKSSTNNEIGAAINVPPNAARFLIAWGLDPAQWRWVKSRRAHMIDPFTLEPTAALSDEKMIDRIGGVPMWLCHRVDLHNALKWMATRVDGPGVPVDVHFKAPVAAYNPSKPSIILSDGQEICGDLVVGADGVHSLAPEAILGRMNEPVIPAHYNHCYRFLIPAHRLEEDPETRFFAQDLDGWTRLFSDNNNHRRLVAYPCRENSILNFVGILHEEDFAETRENWHTTVDMSRVLQKFAGYNPRLLKVMSKATDAKRWPLLYRHPLPTWNKGRMTLAGDAAHPMLPHQGQGGALALEDGLALGIILCGATNAKEIEQRLDIYYNTRHERTSAIQILSNVGADQACLVSDELLEYMAEEDIPRDFPSITRYTFGFDVVRTTISAMKDFDPTFELPGDFFDSPVIGVPER